MSSKKTQKDRKSVMPQLSAAVIRELKKLYSGNLLAQSAWDRSS
jgi:hypothetical protein